MPDAPASLNGASKPKFNQLTWSDRASNEAGYRVYRSADNGASWQVVATNLPADTTRFQDRSSRASGRTYLYVVAAYNGAGEAKSNVASVVNK
jgi:hypothetical protein